jgi:hypothetical protein
MDKTITIEVIDGLFESPHFVGHKRGRNWAAILNGRNAANVERDALKKTGGGEYYDVGALQAGSALEIGSEYTSSGGNCDYNRHYFNVVEIDDNRLILVYRASAAKAMQARPEHMKPQKLAA